MSDTTDSGWGSAWCVLDTETNILAEKDSYSSQASPFHPHNHIIYLGYQTDEFLSPVIVKRTTPTSIREDVDEYVFESEVLIGHNIKFDLLHLRKFSPEKYKEWVKRGGMVWDTMVVEYLLSGQSKQLPSLDYCSEKYGGTLKDNRVQEYWKAGIDTPNIPEEQILPYLEQDVINTLRVKDAQWEQVLEKGMLPLVVTQMDTLLALVEMEWNGICFDKEAAIKEMVGISVELNKLLKTLLDVLRDTLPSNMKNTISVNSSQQIALTLYGGTVKCIKEVPAKLDAAGLPVRFKTGKRKGEIKTKKEEYDEVVVGLWLGKYGSTHSDTPSTDDKALRTVMASTTSKKVEDFCTTLLNYRRYKKELDTYYRSYVRYCHEDSLIHPNFNQCVTATGRLSCNSPNLQNLSNKSLEADDE